VDVDLDEESGAITQGDVKMGQALAHLTGTFHTQSETQVLNMKLDAPNMPVEGLQAMLPSLGVVLPSGSQFEGRHVVGQLGHRWAHRQAGGSLAPVRLANTKLAGFDLGSKLGALSAFTGKNPPPIRIRRSRISSLNARVARRHESGQY